MIPAPPVIASTAATPAVVLATVTLVKALPVLSRCVTVIGAAPIVEAEVASIVYVGAPLVPPSIISPSELPDRPPAYVPKSAVALPKRAPSAALAKAAAT